MKQNYQHMKERWEQNKINEPKESENYNQKIVRFVKDNIPTKIG